MPTMQTSSFSENDKIYFILEVSPCCFASFIQIEVEIGTIELTRITEGFLTATN